MGARLMARKILNQYQAPEEGQGETQKVHFPVLDVLETSLSAPKELDPSIVDDWGPTDRLDEGVTAVTPESDTSTLASLMESISTSGQRLPILVRPHKKNRNRFEVIYGRRRLAACRQLGIPVKAYVQNMDDQTALLEKGIENANRRDLSFYEKALFAENIASQFQKTADIAEILGTGRTSVQHLMRVTKAIPTAVGRQIGPAPQRGRRHWFQLAEAFETQSITQEQALESLAELNDLPSDQKLDELLKVIGKGRAQSRVKNERTPVEGVSIKAGQGVSMKVSKGPFADWLNDHLDDLLTRAHEEFKATSNTED